MSVDKNKTSINNLQQKIAHIVCGAILDCFYVSISEKTFYHYYELSKSDTSECYGALEGDFISLMCENAEYGYKDPISSFLSLNTLRDRLINNQSLKLSFVTISKDVYEASWIPMDIGENEALLVVKKLNEANIERLDSYIMNGLLVQYNIVYFIDLESDLYKSILVREDFENTLKKTGQLSLDFTSNLINIIRDDYIDIAKSFLDLNSINYRLFSSPLMSLDFIDKITDKWQRISFLVSQKNSDGEATKIILAIRNIDDEKHNEIYADKLYQQLVLGTSEVMEMKQKVGFDHLTGVKNRSGFDSVIAELPDTIPIGFALIDIDKFKLVNDNYGHDIGDKVLIKVAKTLSRFVRGNDHVIRFGGDEFAILFVNFDNSQGFYLIERMDKINSILLNPDDELPPVSLSIGLSFSPLGYSSELYNKADIALYNVKRNGRCGCKIWCENMK